MISDLVTARHLSRKAVIYIRQSTPHQVLTNQESLRLQYALHQRARDLGWEETGIQHPDPRRRPIAASVSLATRGGSGLGWPRAKVCSMSEVAVRETGLSPRSGA